MMESLSLRPPTSPLYAASAGSKLMIREEGKVVPTGSTLEIKTRVFHKHIYIQEVLPQLWVSQTPNLVRAYHERGSFERPEVEDVTHELNEWEEGQQKNLERLAALIKKIINVVKKSGGRAEIKYDRLSDKLIVKKADGGRILPDDLYSKFDGRDIGKAESIEDSAIAPKTAET